MNPPAPESIHSRDNPKFKSWLKLLTARGIKRAGTCLVAGRKIVPELLNHRSADDAGVTLLYAEGMERLDVSGAAHVSLARELFSLLDELGTNFPLAVVQAPVSAAWPSQKLSGLVLGIAAQDPANLGSIIRSAVAFGAAGALLFEECAHPFLPKVTRAASGANFRLPLFAGPSINAFDGQGAYGLDMDGDPLDPEMLPEDLILVLGEEGAGLPRDFLGRRLSIPISDKIESLNVAVSAGIALAAYRQRYPSGGV